MNGARRIAAERKRQIKKEGWSVWHDVYVNKDDELVKAAMCYAMPEWLRKITDEYGNTELENTWPWDRKWWKPSPDNRIRELEKAGALIAAEIDRLLRLEEKKK
jgi:hypothetical protein